jgi:mono/diheme cytochrome c family protein
VEYVDHTGSYLVTDSGALIRPAPPPSGERRPPPAPPPRLRSPPPRPDTPPSMRASLPLLALLALAVGLAGCRGMRSGSPPIHPNLNMDFSEAFKPQSPNPFFADNAAMRPPVPGTVARERVRTSENAPFYLGRSADGAFVGAAPVAVTPAVLARGEERYEIFCSVCHGSSGDGRGIIMAGNGGQGYGYTPAPTFHSEYLQGVADGYLYSVIANGIRNMPSYGHQLSVADRWAVVMHVRALQRSQGAAEGDVPQQELMRLQTANPNITLQ